MRLEISCVENFLLLKPQVYPGLLNYHLHESISILLVNLTSVPIFVKKCQQVACAMLVPINMYQGIYNVGTLADLGLEEDPKL